MNAYSFHNVCFDAGDQRRYQDKLAADDRSAKQIARTTEDWSAWIKAAFLAGMADPARALSMPYVRYSPSGVSKVERQPFAHALSESLDHEDIMQRLVAVLASSACPQVAALRAAMAEKYAKCHAEDIAQAEAE